MGVIEKGMELYGFPRPLRVRTCRGREQKDLTNEQLGHSGPENWSIVCSSEGQSEKLGALEEAIRNRSPGVVAIEVLDAGYLLKTIPGALGSSVNCILRNFRTSDLE